MEHLITKEQKIQMLKNGLQTKKDHNGNHWPVVKLFTPDEGEFPSPSDSGVTDPLGDSPRVAAPCLFRFAENAWRSLH